MKSIKSISILAVLLLINISLFANNEGENNKKEINTHRKELSNEIKSLITFPEFAKSNQIEGFVLIQFGYDSNGKLNVIEANSNNSSLKNYVIEKMEALQMCINAKQNDKEYYIRFDFKLL